MIHLIFVLMLISGFIQEITTLSGKQTSKGIALVYAFGAIFFIFWHEPYIKLSLIYCLTVLSFLDFFAKKDSSKLGKFIVKADPAFSLIVLVLLAWNYINYFYKLF